MAFVDLWDLLLALDPNHPAYARRERALIGRYARAVHRAPDPLDVKTRHLASIRGRVAKERARRRVEALAARAIAPRGDRG